MNQNEKIEDIKKRMEVVNSWPARFQELFSKKAMRRTEFCAKHGLHLAWLIRAPSFDPMPKWKSILIVEIGFQKEGIGMSDIAKKHLKKKKADEAKQANIS